MSVSISIKNVIKRYGDNTVIPDLSAKIHDGEFFTLLGPSGCGKTTLLRMIAGFNTMEGGEISFDDKIINNIPAHLRNIGMVFQNYAIFPHLTVRQNVAYGLKIRKLPKAELNKRIDDMLDVVQITEYQDRLPENLSGGQQQRVALARAIVIHPSVLLMDEPLSNLDAKLRVEMRGAIRDIQKTVGITTVYVTHDQEEALSVSDRIAVMKDGVIQQLGAPESIYTRPYNSFVSTFIGHSNTLSGRIKPEGSGYTLSFGDGCALKMDNLRPSLGESEVQVSVRPEEFMRTTDAGMAFIVKSKVFLGRYITYELASENHNGPLIQWSQDIGQSEKTYAVGERVVLMPNAAKINIFTLDGEESLIQGVQQYGA